jgi:iron complex transport system substrate-binding protein
MALRTVHVPAEVKRVVALSPSALEYAAAFDLEIVGRASDATFPASAASAPAVGSTISPKFDEIAALNPDLVIGDAGLQGALRPSFDEFPYPVFLIKVASYEESLHAFRAVGEAVGQKERAEELVAGTEAKVAEAKQSIVGKLQPKVLILTGSGRDVYAGSDASYVGSLVKLLGATNVLGAAPQGAPIAGFGLVEVEQAAVTAPDVVLIVAGSQSDLRAQIQASPAWAESRAVRDGCRAGREHGVHAARLDAAERDRLRLGLRADHGDGAPRRDARPRERRDRAVGRTRRLLAVGNGLTSHLTVGRCRAPSP